MTDSTLSEPIPQTTNRTRRDNHDGTYKRRADGRWEVQIRLPNGKRKSLYAATKEQLKSKHRQLKKELAAGVDVTRSDTVAEFMTDWLRDVVAVTTRPRTHAGYVSYNRLYIAPALGKIKLRDLKQQDVDRMLRAMTDAGRSPATVKQCRAILRAALNYGIRAGLVERNVAQHARPPARKQVERPYLTAEQAGILLAAARDQDPELEPLLTVALYTGLRYGELAGLRWQDVDLTARTLKVRQTVHWINGEYGFGEPKTQRSARTLVLPRPAVEALMTQRDRQAFLKRQAEHRWRPYDLVFATVLGTPLDPSNSYRRLRLLLAATDLPACGFHALRHSCASLLLAAGVPMRSVMEQLGHSQMSLTADLYSHVAPAMLAGNADALEKAMTGS